MFKMILEFKTQSNISIVVEYFLSKIIYSLALVMYRLIIDIDLLEKARD